MSPDPQPYDFVNDLDPAADTGPATDLDHWTSGGTDHVVVHPGPVAGTVAGPAGGTDRSTLGPDLGPDGGTDGTVEPDRVAQILDQLVQTPVHLLNGGTDLVHGIWWLAVPVHALLSRSVDRNGWDEDLAWEYEKAKEQENVAMVRQVRAEQERRWSERKVQGEPEPAGPDLADRTAVVAGAIVVLVVLVVLGAIFGPWLLGPALGAVVWSVPLVLLGRWVRSNPDRSMDHDPVQDLDQPVQAVQSVPPTVDQLNEAMRSAGVFKDRSGEAEITDITPETNGWACNVNLPGATTVLDMSSDEARRRMAAVLDTEKSCVLVEPVAGYEGRARLWLPDHDPLRSGPYRSPLLDMAEASLVAGFPFGTDIRGRRVIAAMYLPDVGCVHYLVGGGTSTGKTFATRALMLAAAMYPHSWPIVHDPFGIGAWSGFARVGEYYEGGAESPEVVLALLERLERLLDEDRIHRRQMFKQCREAGTHNITRSVVTPEMLEDSRLRMPFVPICLDEAQTVFSLGNLGERFKAAVMALVKEGRTWGYCIILSSQKPTGGAIPTDIRDICNTRFALSCPNSPFATSILGERFREEKGADPVTLLPGIHNGSGYFWGAGKVGAHAGPMSALLSTDLIEDRDADRILDRAVELRQARRPDLLPASETTSDSPAEEDREADGQVLLDLVDVYTRLGAEALATKLIGNELRRGWPERYGRLPERGVPKLVRPYGLKPHLMDCMTHEGMQRTSGLTLSEVRAARREWERG